MPTVRNRSRSWAGLLLVVLFGALADSSVADEPAPSSEQPAPRLDTFPPKLLPCRRFRERSAAKLWSSRFDPQFMAKKSKTQMRWQIRVHWTIFAVWLS